MTDTPAQGDPPWWTLKKLPGGEVEITMGAAGYFFPRLGIGCFGLFTLSLGLLALFFSEEPSRLFEVLTISIGSLALLGALLSGGEGETWLLSPGKATRFLSPRAKMTEIDVLHVHHETRQYEEESDDASLYVVGMGDKARVASHLGDPKTLLAIGQAMANVLEVRVVQTTVSGAARKPRRLSPGK